MPEDKSVKEPFNEFSLANTCQSSNFLRNLLDIIETHPSEAAINFGKSIIYFIVDDYDKSLSYLEFLIEKYPNLPVLHHRIAEILINSSDYEKAAFHLEKVLEFDKENLTAKIWLCLTYFRLCDTVKAYKLLNEIKGFVFILRAGEIEYTALTSFKETSRISD